MMRLAQRMLLACIALISLMAVPTEARTFNVGSGRPGDYPYIQDAINDAVLHGSPGDTVLVAAGTYGELRNRNLDFNGKDLVFLGAGQDLTIIDCEVNGRGFVFNHGETAASRVEGVTVRYGHADLLDGTTDEWIGGGVYCNGASPTFVNVIFEHCFARTMGGAVGCYNNASPTFTNCRMTDNRSDEIGGGIYVYNGDPVFDHCYIGQNISRGDGGGVECVGNTISIGGHPVGGAAPVFQWCTIVENVTGYVGGGMYADGCTLTLTHSTVAYNEGLGVQTVGLQSVTIDHTLIAFNTGWGLLLECGNVTCTDSYGNHDGNWGWYSPAYSTHDIFSEDPHFCGTGDYTLRSDSPCTGASCGQVGAYGVGCTATATQPTTWGGLKTLFR